MSLAQFVEQYRTDVLRDFPPRPPACSVCVIHRVSPGEPGECEPNCCQYFFEGEPTSYPAHRDAWIIDALREAYRAGGAQLFLRWARRLNRDTDASVFVYALGYRRIYHQYSMSDFRIFVSALRETGGTFSIDRSANQMSIEECAILDTPV
jgi:hypothetical protein